MPEDNSPQSEAPVESVDDASAQAETVTEPKVETPAAEEKVTSSQSKAPVESVESEADASKPEEEAPAKAKAAEAGGEETPKAVKSAKGAEADEEEAPKAAKAAKGAKADGEAAPKAKLPKKEAVEDKPFGDFIAQDYIPALEKAFASKDVSDLKLSFDSNQVSGQWLNGQRQFTIYFPQESISAQRAFSCTTGKNAASTIEPFLGDERKITLDLLVFGVIQRLNAQKWFGNN